MESQQNSVKDLALQIYEKFNANVHFLIPNIYRAVDCLFFSKWPLTGQQAVSVKLNRFSFTVEQAEQKKKVSQPPEKQTSGFFTAHRSTMFIIQPVKLPDFVTAVQRTVRLLPLNADSICFSRWNIVRGATSVQSSEKFERCNNVYNDEEKSGDNITDGFFFFRKKKAFYPAFYSANIQVVRPTR